MWKSEQNILIQIQTDVRQTGWGGSLSAHSCPWQQNTCESKERKHTEVSNNIKVRRSVGPDLLLNWGRRLQKHQMFSFQFFCRMLLTVQFTQQHFSEESDWTLFCACSMEGMWPAEWTSEGARLLKRNMVVADDAAFREKSKLLTAMERQKWLNSYMQKLLVVNS